jgi:hypothetical protein
MKIVMQLTLTEFLGFLGFFSSMAIGMWVIINRFTQLEGRVGRLEEKVDEILRFLKRKKMKHLSRKH